MKQIIFEQARNEGWRKFNAGQDTKVIVLLLAALILLGINIVVVYQYQKIGEKDSQVVDVAGAQRMLTQEIAKSVNAVASGDDFARYGLRASVEAYDNSLKALKNGGNVKGYNLPQAHDSVFPLIKINEGHWAEFKKNAEVVLKESRFNPEFESSLNYIVSNNEELMERSNAVVATYTQLAKADYIHEIDIAGKQRMLSQLLTKHALQVGNGEDKSRDELGKDIKNFDEALKALRYGGIVMGVEVKPAPAQVASRIEDVEVLWTEFKKNAETLQSRNRLNENFASAHSYINKNNLELRSISNDVVVGFTAVAEANNAFMRKMFLALFFSVSCFIGFSVMKAYHVMKSKKILRQSTLLPPGS